MVGRWAGSILGRRRPVPPQPSVVERPERSTPARGGVAKRAAPRTRCGRPATRVSGRGTRQAIPRGPLRSPTQGMTVCWSAAGRSRWHATTGRPKGCPSLRSPVALAARPRRSRRTSTTPPGRRRGRSKARYVGVCRGCGAYTRPRNGKGDAYAYCKVCHPGAIQRRWTRQLVIDAMREWRARYGRLPSSYDWSRTHARRRGGEALERLDGGEWPPASVVGNIFGTWALARAVAESHAPIGREPASGRDRHGSSG